MAGTENYTRSTSKGRDLNGSVYRIPAATAYSAGDRRTATLPEVGDRLLTETEIKPVALARRVFYLPEAMEELINQISY